MPPVPRLFWRSLLAFLALPAVVAFLVPWLLSGGRPFSLTALPIVLAGSGLLLWCVRDF